VRKVLLKMVSTSAVLLLLTGLCLCQADVIQLTNDDFDSVSFYKRPFSPRDFSLIIDALKQRCQTVIGQSNGSLKAANRYFLSLATTSRDQPIFIV